MPIISVVGRKQKKLRLLIAALYVVLTIGAITMVYPFLLMVSTSFTSPVDQDEFRLIPRYLYDEAALYRKYVEAKYNEEIVKYNAWFGTDYTTFEDLQPPSKVNRKFVMEWRRFKESLPLDHQMLMHSFTLSRITPEMVAKYRATVRKQFNEDLDRFNRTYKEANESWLEVGMPTEDWTQRNYAPDRTKKYQAFLKFKAAQPARYLITVPVDGLFQEFLRLQCGDIGAINKALGLKCRSRAEVRLSRRVPHTEAADEWEAFVRKECPVHFISLDDTASAAYRRFIHDKYGNVGAYNRAYHTTITSFDELSVPRTAPDGGIPLVDWIEFLESAVPITMVEVRSPENEFREYLLKKYASATTRNSAMPAKDALARLNRELGTSFRSFDEISPPYAENDLLELRENRKAIRHEFVVRNYREVLEYVILHGRALLNTAILCLGMILATLTVNPLCAYALSRFNLRSTYKILLFLLATMAFPAEVSAIPSFLLIKDLHLLGTYWAIILPGLANGYSIFLLKGFFDSLPRELYEAAVMDGANELQMYWKITIQLSKPVLAVIALGAFTAAYGSFMWAFLVLQNPKMWTLMVWLYQMQIWAPQFLVYAGLVLAAIPTLLVFVFCQNIIMRGIIVPSEK